MILDVVKWYNPILETIVEPVVEFNENLAALGENMIETMNRYDGLGLSGNQVAAPLRIFVMKRNPEGAGNLVVCNPTIMIWKDAPDQFMNEGCLSVPGIYNQVCRGTKVDMTYQDVNGKEHSIFVEGIEARIVQHEVDHLNGIMFFNRMSRQMRRAVLKEWEKANR